MATLTKGPDWRRSLQSYGFRYESIRLSQASFHHDGAMKLDRYCPAKPISVLIRSRLPVRAPAVLEYDISGGITRSHAGNTIRFSQSDDADSVPPHQNSGSHAVESDDHATPKGLAERLFPETRASHPLDKAWEQFHAHALACFAHPDLIEDERVRELLLSIRENSGYRLARVERAVIEGIHSPEFWLSLHTALQFPDPLRHDELNFYLNAPSHDPRLRHLLLKILFTYAVEHPRDRATLAAYFLFKDDKQMRDLYERSMAGERMSKKKSRLLQAYLWEKSSSLWKEAGSPRPDNPQDTKVALRYLEDSFMLSAADKAGALARWEREIRRFNHGTARPQFGDFDPLRPEYPTDIESETQLKNQAYLQVRRLSIESTLDGVLQIVMPAAHNAEMREIVLLCFAHSVHAQPIEDPEKCQEVCARLRLLALDTNQPNGVRAAAITLLTALSASDGLTLAKALLQDRSGNEALRTQFVSDWMKLPPAIAVLLVGTFLDLYADPQESPKVLKAIRREVFSQGTLEILGNMIYAHHQEPKPDDADAETLLMRLLQAWSRQVGLNELGAAGFLKRLLLQDRSDLLQGVWAYFLLNSLARSGHVDGNEFAKEEKAFLQSALSKPELKSDTLRVTLVVLSQYGQSAEDVWQDFGRNLEELILSPELSQEDQIIVATQLCQNFGARGKALVHERILDENDEIVALGFLYALTRFDPALGLEAAAVLLERGGFNDKVRDIMDSVLRVLPGHDEAKKIWRLLRQSSVNPDDFS